MILIGFIVAQSRKNQPSGNFKLKHKNKSRKKSLHQLQKITLGPKEFKKVLKAEKKTKKDNSPLPKLFVLNFKGDMKATGVDELSQEISLILHGAEAQTDKVLLRLESPGGGVSQYGLAASELSRLKKANLNLEISVDTIAASGGYMMACVGHKVLAAPLAIIGSIGVVAQMPNFNKILKKNDVDLELHTAGAYKRTLTLFGENTDEARSKFKSQLEDIHGLFKNWIRSQRPSLDIDKVATGEFWFGTQAVELGLIDEIKTGEEYLLEHHHSHDIIEVKYAKKPKFMEKLLDAQSSLISSQPQKALEKLTKSQAQPWDNFL